MTNVKVPLSLEKFKKVVSPETISVNIWELSKSENLPVSLKQALDTFKEQLWSILQNTIPDKTYARRVLETMEKSMQLIPGDPNARQKAQDVLTLETLQNKETISFELNFESFQGISDASLPTAEALAKSPKKLDEYSIQVMQMFQRVTQSFVGYKVQQEGEIQRIASEIAKMQELMDKFRKERNKALTINPKGEKAVDLDHQYTTLETKIKDATSSQTAKIETLTAMENALLEITSILRTITTSANWSKEIIEQHQKLKEIASRLGLHEISLGITEYRLRVEFLIQPDPPVAIEPTDDKNTPEQPLDEKMTFADAVKPFMWVAFLALCIIFIKARMEQWNRQPEQDSPIISDGTLMAWYDKDPINHTPRLRSQETIVEAKNVRPFLETYFATKITNIPDPTIIDLADPEQKIPMTSKSLEQIFPKKNGHVAMQVFDTGAVTLVLMEGENRKYHIVFSPFQTKIIRIRQTDQEQATKLPIIAPVDPFLDPGSIYAETTEKAFHAMYKDLVDETNKYRRSTVGDKGNFKIPQGILIRFLVRQIFSDKPPHIGMQTHPEFLRALQNKDFKTIESYIAPRISMDNTNGMLILGDPTGFNMKWDRSKIEDLSDLFSFFCAYCESPRDPREDAIGNAAFYARYAETIRERNKRISNQK